MGLSPVAVTYTLTDSKWFKSKVKITGKIPDGGNKKGAEIAVPLKHLSEFWRTIGITLINCEINLILTWASICVITSLTGEGALAITDTKRYVPTVNLSTQDNAKLLEHLKAGFKREIN